ncbi:hypothetical protein DFJ74DRAFT_453888 [Hyaloraphidium curvatum]|nr:hypothetical protein DFJ74DRAFT_453888 [Hyaloraphidium curvatum]
MASVPCECRALRRELVAAEEDRAALRRRVAALEREAARLQAALARADLPLPVDLDATADSLPAGDGEERPRLPPELLLRVAEFLGCYRDRGRCSGWPGRRRRATASSVRSWWPKSIQAIGTATRSNTFLARGAWQTARTPGPYGPCSFPTMLVSSMPACSAISWGILATSGASSSASTPSPTSRLSSLSRSPGWKTSCSRPRTLIPAIFAWTTSPSRPSSPSYFCGGMPSGRSSTTSAAPPIPRASRSACSCGPWIRTAPSRLSSAWATMCSGSGTGTWSATGPCCGTSATALRSGRRRSRWLRTTTGPIFRPMTSASKSSRGWAPCGT